jgi:hypothetical protein
VRRELAERSFAVVESEINEERAAALGRAGRKVEARFQRCRALVEQIDAAHAEDASTAAQLLDDYRAAREEFEQARWQLTVHREAIGLNNHSWIDRTFPTPPPR